MVLKKSLAVAMIATLGGGAVAGCQTIERETGLGQKGQIGAAGGAATGGLIAAAASASPLWIAASVLLGGITGGALGDWLDRRDQREYAHATYDTFEHKGPGESTNWRNPHTGAHGHTRITDQYVNAEGQTCKTFTQRIHGNGRTETTSGTACQRADGSWVVQSG